MAPSTYELGGKETNSDAKVVFPTTSAEDQLREIHNTKKYKYFAGVVLLSAILISAVIVGSVALHHHLTSKQTDFDTKIVYKGYPIPEHVHVDFTSKITYVNNSRYNEVVAANNLLDYKRQLLVCKDVKNKVCYVDKLNGTFEDGVSKLSKKKDSTPVKHVITVKLPVDKRILQKFAGDSIADHCKGTPSFWVLDMIPTNSGCTVKRLYYTFTLVTDIYGQFRPCLGYGRIYGHT
ncbi:hypothetical protein LOTGIDRAFT_173606 [Lottia gigantea]|uniref:BRICHOS domain-containing protein n=1 Tax=Lottia gigantea TaxID=225164 RepID=V4CCN5_LOTGI|nr:hypothetical protein LOTGIDRAFT_173606 [Lottia gigantea]ESO99664.1 hypothetical protein LOTGIDRAFT_173606 [Lottia gigantea]